MEIKHVSWYIDMIIFHIVIKHHQQLFLLFKQYFKVSQIQIMMKNIWKYQKKRKGNSNFNVKNKVYCSRQFNYARVLLNSKYNRKKNLLTPPPPTSCGSTLLPNIFIWQQERLVILLVSPVGVREKGDFITRSLVVEEDGVLVGI